MALPSKTTTRAPSGSVRVMEPLVSTASAVHAVSGGSFDNARVTESPASASSTSSRGHELESYQTTASEVPSATAYGSGSGIGTGSGTGCGAGAGSTVPGEPGVEPEPPLAGSPFELARTLLALGTVQRRARHKRAARESLQRAADIFEGLGARLWLEKARSELRRIGGRSASEGELSETERRIVELVVAGRRNREVAAELSLSPNTVAWNLSKIYRKLGVSSRTELAAHVATTPPG